MPEAQERQDDTALVAGQAAGVPVRRWRPAAIAVNLLLVLALVLLLLASLTAVAVRQLPPVYRLIQDTPLESFGLRLAGFLNTTAAAWRYRLAALPLLGGDEKVRRMLIADITRQRPTHVVSLAEGGAMAGILSKTGKGYLFKHETPAGVRMLRFQEADLAGKREIIYPDIELSAADCRFLLNFPGLHYYHMPPFLFVTDTPYSQVHAAYEALEELRLEMLVHFRPLIRNTELEDLLRVCLFSSRGAYIKHSVAKEDIHLETSLGMFLPGSGILLVYDPARDIMAASLAANRRQLAAAAAQYTADELQNLRLAAVADLAAAQLRAAGELNRSLRHEGAHQLAYAYGIHSAAGNEPLWLLEGLAQYCETKPFGASQAGKIRDLQAAAADNRLIPWQELFEVPAASGFIAAFGAAEPAYAQAWFAFRHCMEKPRSGKFLFFMDRVRELQPGEASAAKLLDLLGYSMQTHFITLSRDLTAAVRFIGPPRPAAAAPAGNNSPAK